MLPLGSVKLKRKFLILPLKLNGETRWLEHATIECKWSCLLDRVYHEPYWYYWRKIRFVDMED